MQRVHIYNKNIQLKRSFNDKQVLLCLFIVCLLRLVLTHDIAELGLNDWCSDIPYTGTFFFKKNKNTVGQYACMLITQKHFIISLIDCFPLKYLWATCSFSLHEQLRQSFLETASQSKQHRKILKIPIPTNHIYTQTYYKLSFSKKKKEDYIFLSLQKYETS